MQLNNALQSSIEALPLFVGKSCTITAIDSGLSHNNFAVSLLNTQQVEERYFVKCFTTTNRASLQEVRATYYVMQHGLAPKVLYHDDMIMVVEFVEATSLADKHNMTPATKLAVVMPLLANLHQLPIHPEFPQLIMPQLLASLMEDALLSGQQQKQLDNALKHLPVLPTCLTPVLCHGDANFSNILLDERQRSWLVDYECSIVADAAFDIAMCIAINLLTIEEFASSLAHYHRATDKLIQIEHVKSYLPYCYLINALWFISKAKKSPNETIFTTKAHEQLVQLDTCLATSVFRHFV